MGAARKVGAVVVVFLMLGAVAAIGGVFGGSSDSPDVSIAAAQAETVASGHTPAPERTAPRNLPEDRPRSPDTTAPEPIPTTTVHPIPTTTNPPPTSPPTSNPPPTNPPAPTPTRPQTSPDSPPSTTIPGPQGVNAGSFEVWLRGGSDNAPDRFWWNAIYLRQLALGLDTGWTDGDRSGYKCLYAFLTLDEQIVGRVTFTRVPEAASYAVVKDENMVEGERYYDGTLAPADASIELGDCPPPSEGYTPHTGPDQRPTILYSLTSGATLEIRNYKPLVVGDGITFQQTSATSGRITVVAYEWGNPAIVVYYDSMSPNVVMSSDL